MRIHGYLHKFMFICILILIFTCAGCGKSSTTVAEAKSPESGYAVTPAISPEHSDSQMSSASPVPDAAKDYYGDYMESGGEVALVIDCNGVEDNGYNQAAYEGVKTYAQAAGVSYSYYCAESDTDEAYVKALEMAIANNAKLMICVSAHFEQALGSLQEDFTDIHFLLLDGVPRDASGKELPIAPNVHCVSYHEEEAGYLAGYMTVLEGYTNLGFIGGETFPSIKRYGAGFLQGIDAAACELGISDDVSVNYGYTDTILPDQRIEEVSAKWYESGTEIIFACGGSIYESVLSSAESCNGLLIGADTDHSSISKLFLTSAMKEINYSVIMTLDEYFACGNNWPEELAGQLTTYGISDKCIGLPLSDHAWRFETVLYSDYTKLLSRIKNGEIKISDNIASLPKTSIQVNYHNDL